MKISGEGKYDLSFIVSLRCDLECPHCQYDAGRQKRGLLDKRVFTKFIYSIRDNWEDINSFGFYGGEVSISIPEWESYIRYIRDTEYNLVYGPRRYKKNRKPKWIVTNGSWSRNQSTFYQMISFANRNDLTVYISTTPYHQEYQDLEQLHILTKSSDRFKFKKDDTKSRLLPMGRNFREDWDCTMRCQRQEETERIAVMPNGDVIYQKCDGIYPVVANISNSSMTWPFLKFMLYNQLSRSCPVLTGEHSPGDSSWVKKAAEYLVPEPVPERKLKYLSA